MNKTINIFNNISPHGINAGCFAKLRPVFFFVGVLIFLEMTYKEQLDNKEWKEKQLEIKKRDKFRCRICGSRINLHVHHLYYIPKLKAWEYENEGLVTVCDLHHELLTFELTKLSGIIAFEILTKQFEL